MKAEEALEKLKLGIVLKDEFDIIWYMDYINIFATKRTSVTMFSDEDFLKKDVNFYIPRGHQ